MPTKKKATVPAAPSHPPALAPVPDPTLPPLPWILQGLQKTLVRQRLGQLLSCGVDYLPDTAAAAAAGLESLTNGWDLGQSLEFQGLVHVLIHVLIDCRHGSKAGRAVAIVPLPDPGHVEVWIQPLSSVAAS